MLAFKIIYWLAMVAEVIIRTPFATSVRTKAKTEGYASPTENILLGFLTVAMGLLPLIYSATNWLSFADYSLPAWAGWLGVVILIFSVLIFMRAHMDLKSNWSPSVEIYSGYTLITNGIYRIIRHPMYTSQLAWAIAQILMLQNWIAGPASLILFIPFYILRSGAEEKMMLAKFGEQYHEYMKISGGIIPKF